MFFSLQDVAAAATLAKQLYVYGFSRANSAKVQYNDFMEEVKNLGTNLESLVQCVNSFQQETSGGPQGSHPILNGPRLDTSTLLEVCGNFQKTIRECETLLKVNLSYLQASGVLVPLTNIKWNFDIKDEVVRLSKCLASHNRKILLAIEPVKLTLHYEAKLSQQYGFQYLASLQEESTRQLEKKLCRVLKLLGETGEDCQPETPEPETLSIRPGIAEHLDSEFVKAYPDGYGLTLKDGSNGMRYHLDRSLGISRPGGTTGAVPAIEKYLHLMKCVFLLEKVKSSHEYAEKVKGARNLLWFAVLQDLEDRCRRQFRRYSTNEPEANRLQSPSNDEFRWLYQNSYAFYFEDDESIETSVPTGLTLGRNDEISYLTLHSDTRNEEQKLAIARLSRPSELELRWTRFANSPHGRAGGVVTPLHVHLKRALLLPIWAEEPMPQKWIIRFRGDADFHSEAEFVFSKAPDLQEFQQAILGYRVFYDSRGTDVELRIHDRSGDPKDVFVQGKFEMWQDRELGPVSASTSPLGPQTLTSPPPSPSNPVYPSSSLRSPSQSSSFWKRASFLSIPSSESSNHTASSRTTYTSAHTSTVRTLDGNSTVVRLKETTEPMLVFIIRCDKEGSKKYSLLGIKLEPNVVAKPGCSITQCRRSGQCSHVTIERKNSKALNALRVDFASNKGWNLATLGKHQQNSQRVQRPDKLLYVHVTLASPQNRETFIKSFDLLKEISDGSVQEQRQDRRDLERLNFIKET